MCLLAWPGSQKPSQLICFSVRDDEGKDDVFELAQRSASISAAMLSLLLKEKWKAERWSRSWLGYIGPCTGNLKTSTCMAGSNDLDGRFVTQILPTKFGSKVLFRWLAILHAYAQTMLPSFLLVPSSRKQLFSRITLRNDRACQTIHQISRPKSSHSEPFTLTEYIDVQVSHFENFECQWMNSASLLATLRLPFRCLERFSINVSPDGEDMKPWNWNSFSSELKGALSNSIIHSFNLTVKPFPSMASLKILQFHPLHNIGVAFRLADGFSLRGLKLTDKRSFRRSGSNGFRISPSDRPVWEKKLSAVHTCSKSTSTSVPEPGITSCPSWWLLLLQLHTWSFYINLSHSLDNEDTDSFYEDADVWSRLDTSATHPFGSLLQRVDIYVD